MEIEIKLALASAAAGRRLLRSAGFQVFKRRAFESNTLFDTTGQLLALRGSLLRVRQTGRSAAAVLTFKGPAEVATYKSREELEVEVDQARKLEDVLARLDFVPKLRYEKYRSEFRRPRESGIAMLDETPIGVYLELEGSPAWIDRQAHRLGFQKKDYITDSYYSLYAAYCHQRGLQPGHMTFREVGG